jgi:hypothetical protein
MKNAEIEKTTKKKGAGKNSIMNGRALFTYNPDLFVDDDNAAAEADMEDIKEEAEEAKVDTDLFAGETVDADEEVDFD